MPAESRFTVPGSDMNAALSALGLGDPCPVLVLVGGAANIAPEVADALLLLFEMLAPELDALGVALIDGGTAFGVMALMGEARHCTAARFPLIGVAARGTVAPATLPAQARVSLLPGAQDAEHWTDPEAAGGKAARLDPNHSHFLLTPGDRWGDEVAWIDAAADCLAAGLPSLTLVAAGGQITRLDVAMSLESGRHLIVLSGSGGTADQLAAWWRGGEAIADLPLGDRERALIQVVELTDAADRLPDLLTQVFAPTVA